MTFHYNQQHSEIFELTMLPMLSYSPKDRMWDFTPKERSILAKDLERQEEIYQLFKPLEARLRSYHLMAAGWSFLTTCYIYLLNQGYEPADIEELHQLVLGMSEEELDHCLRVFIIDESFQEINDKDYWEILEERGIKPEDKWHILAYSRNMTENIKKTVELSRELVALYQPYFEQARQERERYAQNINLEEVLKNTHALKMVQQTVMGEGELYIISPWMIRLSLLSLESIFERYKTFLILSCKINEVLNTHSELDEENFSSVLKTLSDLTRYKVLVALTQPHAKSKDIAQDLGITSAAVSFHRQKLQNAQILLFNSDEKNVKYDPNRDLIQEVIDKLRADFKLN